MVTYMTKKTSLEELRTIDKLLTDRACLRLTIENIKFTETRCLSVRIDSKIKCKKAIQRLADDLEHEFAIKTYNLLVSEYNDVCDRLDEMGVDAERKEFVDGTKKVMIDGLKEKHSAGRAPQHSWEIGPTGAENFDYFIDKYK